MPVRQRIVGELREIGLVTLYFLTCFLLFLTLKKLLLADYHVRVTVLHTAVIGALVVAKVVVLLGKSSFGNYFRSWPPLVHVLWRSLTYTAAVFVVTLAERLFESYREASSLSGAFAEMWSGRDIDHFLALNLAVGLSFFVYNTYAEIDRHLGEGSLRRFFLTR